MKTQIFYKEIWCGIFLRGRCGWLVVWYCRTDELEYCWMGENEKPNFLQRNLMWHFSKGEMWMVGCLILPYRWVEILLNGREWKTKFFTKKFNVACFWGGDVDGWLFDAAITDELKYFWMGESCMRNRSFHSSCYPTLSDMTQEERPRNLGPHIDHWPWYERPSLAQSLTSLILFMLT